MNVAEYKALSLRQEEILIDAEGVAKAVQKVNNSAGKQILASIGSIGLNAVGIPLQIPKEFGYVFLGVFGIIAQQREFNKLKKYYARLAELEAEYNKNRLKIAEFNIDANLGRVSYNETLPTENEPKVTGIESIDSVVNSVVRSAKSLSFTKVILLVGAGLVVRKIYKNRNKNSR